MTFPDDSTAVRLERALRAYLTEHPNAADSALGIQRWWLPEEFAFVGIGELVLALRAIVATGQLVEHHLPDGSVVYTAARAGKPPA